MLITAEEVSVQTKQEYTGDDLAQVNSFIADVTSAIEVFCRKTFSDPVPRAIKAVAMMEVRRLLNTEPGVSTERISDLSTSYAYGGSGFVLSSSAKSDLRDYMRSTRPPWGSIRLIGPRACEDEDDS